MLGWPSSLRSRLTLWYTVLLALPLTAFAIVCYVVFAHSLLGRTDRFIGDALAAFSRELAAERRIASTVEEALHTTVEEVRFHDLHIAIVDSARRMIASTPRAAADAADRQRGHDELDMRISAAIGAHDVMAPLAVTVIAGGQAYRLVTQPLTMRGQSFEVAGTYSLRDSDETLRRIRQIFAIAIPLLILSAATGGSVLAKRSLAPMSAMTAQAMEITASNLHERFPVAGGNELVALAHVVNGLLDRLERSFEQQRQFMTDASHELRTPTAILRTETDVTLSREHRTEEEYRASVTVMQDAARRLTRIVDDLFLLARADADQLVTRHESLYLEELVHDAARGVAQLAARRGVSVVLGQVVEAPFRGDADLLGRLLLNLLDNAIKHCEPGATVDIGVARRDGNFEIAVIDSGSGIPSTAHHRVFERFFRVDDAAAGREAGAPQGAGLGLAIARRIAEVHGGHLELVESRPGRTEFRLTLPATASGERSHPDTN
jgi:heavy metal sensor kinase